MSPPASPVSFSLVPLTCIILPSPGLSLFSLKQETSLKMFKPSPQGSGTQYSLAQCWLSCGLNRNLPCWEWYCPSADHWDDQCWVPSGLYCHQVLDLISQEWLPDSHDTHALTLQVSALFLPSKCLGQSVYFGYHGLSWSCQEISRNCGSYPESLPSSQILQLWLDHRMITDPSPELTSLSWLPVDSFASLWYLVRNNSPSTTIKTHIRTVS